MFETMTNMMVVWSERYEKMKEKMEARVRAGDEQKLVIEVENQRRREAELAKKDAIEEQNLISSVLDEDEDDDDTDESDSSELRRINPPKIYSEGGEITLKENDAHKTYQGLNGGNDFKHCEAYNILARDPQWANLRDDGMNHTGNEPRNIARRTSDNSSPGNSVGSNTLSDDLDGPLIPQFAGPNSKLDGSLYEGGSKTIGQKFFRKNLITQKALDGVSTAGSGIQTILDKL
ncbi:hypothetical protein GIB67_009249 [Kingdonia uniflora]|uniref:Uncharacterized protein n=1 Tax=Kingdonia uniflora TaxID=39325 RepID=A0A7J7N2W5_9MAGN|nr:hypothetical protein GIB67_009249 [Kingdonia uniflora]